MEILLNLLSASFVGCNFFYSLRCKLMRLLQHLSATFTQELLKSIESDPPLPHSNNLIGHKGTWAPTFFEPNAQSYS
jgi:hypothetical protein